MSSHIPQAATDAAAAEIPTIPIGSSEDDYQHIARRALEAAMPHIRAQIVREFLEAAPTDVSTPYRDGVRDGFYQAARIAEKGIEQ